MLEPASLGSRSPPPSPPSLSRLPAQIMTSRVGMGKLRGHFSWHSSFVSMRPELKATPAPERDSYSICRAC